MKTNTRKLIYVLMILISFGIFSQVDAEYFKQGKAKLKALSHTTTKKQAASKLLKTSPLPSESNDEEELKHVPGEIIVKFKGSRAKSIKAQLLRNRKGKKGTLTVSGYSRLSKRLEKYRVTKAKSILAGKKFGKHKGEFVKFESSQDEKIDQLIKELNEDPNIEYAQRNYVFKNYALPNDFYIDRSPQDDAWEQGDWGQPFADLWGLQKLQAVEAWEQFETQGEGVIVAVVDTGVDRNHPDLAQNIWQNSDEAPGDANGDGFPGRRGVDDDGDGLVDEDSEGRQPGEAGYSNDLRDDDDENGFVDDSWGWNFSGDNPFILEEQNNDPMDDNGHGTHVSGTIAAVANNGIGIAGVAPRAEIMAVKGLSGGGSGTSEGLALALDYAIENGATVINNSWGCGYCPTNPLIEEVVQKGHEQDVVIVFAAGNSATDVFDVSPQNQPETITVAATDPFDNRSLWDEFGSGSSLGLMVDVGAPGGGPGSLQGIAYPHASILSLQSSINDYPEEILIGNDYARLAGTSMASPHAAGLAALIRSKYPDFSNEQVRQAMRQGADDIESPGFDTFSGKGRINAMNSLAISDPLEVLIKSPIGTQLGENELSVRLLVRGNDLRNWRFEAGLSDTPENWQTIRQGTLPIDVNQLFTWDISNIADGFYSLRLTAEKNNGEVYEYRSKLQIDRIFIDTPIDLTGIREGDPIELRGTVNPAQFRNYLVQIIDARGAPINNALLTLANDGNQPVENGLIATWDTTGITNDHYTIRLVVSDTLGQQFTEEVKVLVDAELKPGFPLVLERKSLGGLFRLPTIDHLTLADINGDGRQNLLLAHGGSMQILDGNGQNIAGWPQDFSEDESHGAISGVTVGDLDGDSRPEIITASTSLDLTDLSNSFKVNTWHADGRVYEEFSMQNDDMIAAKFAIADLNCDGQNEIVASGSSNRFENSDALGVFDNSGAPLPGWPIHFQVRGNIEEEGARREISAPLIGDLDNQGCAKEIAVVAKERRFNNDPNDDILEIHTFNLNGSLFAPQIDLAAESVLGFFGQSKINHVLADINGDGRDEMIVGNEDGKVYALRPGHTTPILWVAETAGSSVEGLAVGDMDNDGRPEIVASIFSSFTDQTLRNGSVFIFDANGDLLPNWPVTIQTQNQLGLARGKYGAPVLADINGDNIAEVIVPGPSEANFNRETPPYALHAYDLLGNLLPGFPRASFGSQTTIRDTAAVGDIDGDGLYELLWADSRDRLYAWDLPNATARENEPWPMILQNENRTGKVSTKRRESRFIRMDSNMNQRIEIADAVAILHYLFIGDVELTCLDAADANDSGTINITDAQNILQYLFTGEFNNPPAPFPNPGTDSTDDALSCEQSL